MLFLVVCCLEISDILFAVDSVSAIVAQVSDLFLAYTSAVFAMLGLRSTFFIIDVVLTFRTAYVLPTVRPSPFGSLADLYSLPVSSE